MWNLLSLLFLSAVLETVSLDKFIPETPTTSEPGDMSPCRSPSTPRHLRYRQAGGGHDTRARTEARSHKHHTHSVAHSITHSLTLTLQCVHSITHSLNHPLSLTHPSILTHLTTPSQSLTNLPVCVHLQCNPGRTHAAQCHRPQPSPSPQQQRVTAALRVTNPSTFTLHLVI